MISFSKQQSLYGDLSGNTATSNLSRGADLANIEHRYLLQKYYNNEGSFTLSTVGVQTGTLTGAPLLGATTATLNSVWSYANNQTNVTFSNGDVKLVSFTRGSASISWVGGLSSSATATITIGGLQFYALPYNYSMLKTVTITIGSLKWTPSEVQSREEWDKLNVFPYYADIPNNYYIYPGGDHGAQIGIWPIPSTTGNTITVNYKFRVPDLSIADTTGTASVSNGSTTVTGTSFAVTMNGQSESRWIQFAQPSGDNLWYQIANIPNSTTIILTSPYQGVSVSGGAYIIGQMPLLAEDFQDMLVWKPLMFYYSTISKDTQKFSQFELLYKEKQKMLDEYSGTKVLSVNLGRQGVNRNPNLYWQG